MLYVSRGLYYLSIRNDSIDELRLFVEYENMLPRKVLPDQDLILCSTHNRTLLTLNVHPLYLSPVVCWLNRTAVQVRYVKRVIFTTLKITSTVLLVSTIFLHSLRLYSLSSWGLLGAMWSLMVCISLTVGLIVAVRSSDKQSNIAVLADTAAGVSLRCRGVTFTLFAITYAYTWLYYNMCGVTAARDKTSLGCSDKIGPHLFPILQWTTFVFVWINTIGFVRLFQHN